MIYMDHCASTPVSQNAQNAMIGFLKENFGNPAVIHHEAGKKSRAVIDYYRNEIAKIFESKPENIVFTSGATESNNMVIKGFSLKYRENGRIIYGASEHKCVVEAVKQMQRTLGIETHCLKVDKNANIDLSDLESLLETSGVKKTLVCLMHTNNEVPKRHPVEDIASLCNKYKAYFHCDAVQGFVREKVSFKNRPCSFMSLSMHKLYGPKGMGILAINPDSDMVPLLEPLLSGGGQEFGYRSGTIASPTIVAGSEAFLEHMKKLTKHNTHMKKLTKTFMSEASKKIPELKYTLNPNEDACGLINFYIEGLNAMVLMDKAPHICLNRGAACSAGSESGSHVPFEMGFPPEVASNVFRASFGWGVTEREVIQAVDVISQVANGA